MLLDNYTTRACTASITVHGSAQPIAGTLSQAVAQIRCAAKLSNSQLRKEEAAQAAKILRPQRKQLEPVRGANKIKKTNVLCKMFS